MAAGPPWIATISTALRLRRLRRRSPASPEGALGLRRLRRLGPCLHHVLALANARARTVQRPQKRRSRFWGRSSVGRAPPLQGGSQEFESPRLHCPQRNVTSWIGPLVRDRVSAYHQRSTPVTRRGRAKASNRSFHWSSFEPTHVHACPRAGSNERVVHLNK